MVATHVLPLASPLKPLAEQVLAVAIKGGRVPVHVADLVGAVEQLEALLVRGDGAIKGCRRCQSCLFEIRHSCRCLRLTAQTHQAEALDGDGRAIATELAGGDAGVGGHGQGFRGN